MRKSLTAPAVVHRLVLDELAEVKVARELICLCPWVADKAAGVEFFCNLHCSLGA